MSPTEAFWWGCGGSAAIELVTALQFYLRVPVRFPERYGLWHFWVFRVLLVLAAGGLAVAADPTNKLAAISMGVAAPLIYEKLGRSER